MKYVSGQIHILKKKKKTEEKKQKKQIADEK